jgi:hypothetical protein
MAKEFGFQTVRFCPNMAQSNTFDHMHAGMFGFDSQILVPKVCEYIQIYFITLEVKYVDKKQPFLS